jgi:hypothetical protein
VRLNGRSVTAEQLADGDLIELGHTLLYFRQGAAPPDARGVTSGLLNLSRNLGLIAGTALMGAVFALAAGTGDTASAPAADVATGTRATFALATALVAGAFAVALAGRPRPSQKLHGSPIGGGTPAG